MSKHSVHDEHTTQDQRLAEEAIRDAFPIDAGLSSEKTRSMYESLRPAVIESARRSDSRFVIGISVFASAAVVASVFFMYAALRPPTPPVSPTAEVAVELPPPSRVVPESSEYVTQAPAGASVVQVRALRAITGSNQILHFTSSADVRFGFDPGQSTEEMWYDLKTGAGRMERTQGIGSEAVRTIVVFDGVSGWVTTREAGKPDVTEKADMTGRLGKSFDKLSAYRQMLTSGLATVTAEGKKDGEKTYKLRAVIDSFGNGEVKLLMEAEVRAEDYLPINYQSGFLDDAGNVQILRKRIFSKFETLTIDDLPKDWFVPSGGKGDSQNPEPQELL